MKRLGLLAVVCASVISTACGGDGGDFEQSLNIGPPQVRLVDAAPDSPLLRLYRKDELQAGAGTQGYEGASKYFDSVAVTSDWSVRDSGSGTQVGTTSMRVENATRYTLVALPGAGNGLSLLQFSDPYSNALTEKARVRVVNGNLQSGSVDVYLTPVGADISSSSPTLAGIATAAVKPNSGDNSYSLARGTYQLRLTAAGSKVVTFRATIELGDHEDLLLVTLPATAGGGTKILAVQSDPDAGNFDIANEIVD